MSDPFHNFYRDRRVFVTGHTGFKGSWLTQWLLELGAQIRGYSLLAPSEPSLFAVLRLERDIDSVIADIRDGERIRKAMNEFKPEVVFHLAAQPLVRVSYEEPRLTYETNVIGTLSVYEAVRSCESVRAVVSVTTDKCYENQEWLWGYREDDLLGGYDPYSSSKACAELMTRAYRNSFFNPRSYGHSHRVAIATARAGNVIGGGDWAKDRLLPDAVRSIMADEPVRIRNPKAIRPWQHVLEPLSGYLRLAEILLRDGTGFGDAWNFGPDESDCISVEHVVSSFLQLWQRTKGYLADGSEQLHEAGYLRLDSSRARQLLQWKPRWKIEEAIVRTVDWYKTFYKAEDPGDLTRTQIHSYESAMTQEIAG
jgi:CDP-glucose 4,6-dehydratase